MTATGRPRGSTSHCSRIREILLVEDDGGVSSVVFIWNREANEPISDCYR